VRVGATGIGGAHANVLAEVGAGGVQTTLAAAVYLVAAGAQGLFSYALFTGKWIFEAKHPVWGVVFALGAMSGLYGAAKKLMESPKDGA